MELVTITEDAKVQIRNLLNNNPGKIIKFGASSGGCSGFSYMMQLVTENEILPEDEIVDFEEFRLIVDGPSIFLIIGTEINYHNDVMGSYFTFDNPNAVAGCGCGTSFSA